jgi:hypothetical protein
MVMTGKEQIKSVYWLTVSNTSFYDGYIEDDDTENGARNTLLGKVAVK